MNMKYCKLYFLTFLAVVFFSCTKLDEQFRGEIEEGTGTNDPAQLLKGAYTSLDGPYQEGNVWHMSEHSSDECLGPTRGPDWDDGGTWRALHLHTWNADHPAIRDCFNGLLQAQFAAS